MTKPTPMFTLGMGTFVLFVVLAGLLFLMGTNHAAPGCAGPVVERCDYVAAAKQAVSREGYPFQSDLGFEVFDNGSSVRVQQYTPVGEHSLNHASSVLIDKNSCRPCRLDWHYPTRGDPRDAQPGELIMRVPADDPAAAARRAKEWEDGPGGISGL
ncbi:hypothetical protein [Brevundimonas sp.]|uniref:hypothetical protein n=1 Tax=Brevundimonas sp. TaxID=1871086 RepID=UPI002611AC27|nr:hypothetical protein [Brevundimonas sp.]